MPLGFADQELKVSLLLTQKWAFFESFWQKKSHSRPTK
jgi:hypothetical protein